MNINKYKKRIIGVVCTSLIAPSITTNISYAKRSNQTQAQTTITEGNTYIVTKDSNVYKNKSLSGKKIVKLTKGTVVNLKEETSKWSKIQYKNKEGYIASSALKKYYEVNPGEVTIKYIDSETKKEIIESEVHKGLELDKYYTYEYKKIEGYECINTFNREVSIKLTEEKPTTTIIFEYKALNNNAPEVEETTLGEIKINYIDVETKESILHEETHKDLELKEYEYNAKQIEGYKLISESTKKVELTKENNIQTINFEYEKNKEDANAYIIDLDEFNISNDNTNATDTTKGINEALKYAKENGYKKVILPKGHYAIDTSVRNPIVLSDGTKTWTHNRQGISMQSGMEFDMTGSILEMIPTEDPYHTVFTISNCEDSKVIGGTILGDRNEHDYGMRINNNGDEFISGDIDSETGEYKVDDSKVVTKDYIEFYEDWFSKEKSDLPKEFFIIPLWNTTMSTVDGGCAYVYCYNENNEYLGLANGKKGYIDLKTLPEGTAKIKVSLRGEKRLDAVVALTTRKVYSTYEFGTGIMITDSNNVEITGVTVKDFIGDCIGTNAPPIDVTVDNLKIINCTLENARRQGISFVATGENYLIKDSNIGNINGTDPQCGIDFEHYGYVRNVVIDAVNFYNNKKWDIINYNGTDIEVKNSKFTGGIGTTYGHTMDIHDNYFEYKDRPEGDKVFKNSALNLNTKNNKVYNNTIKGGAVVNSGENSKTYDNTFIDSTINVHANGSNKYYNCEVVIHQSDKLPTLSNNYFEDSNVTCKSDSPGIEIVDSEFKNSSFNGRGPCVVRNSKFTLEDKHLLGGWKTAATDITFEECDINSKLEFLESGLNTKLTFKNSNITTPRKKIVQYGTTIFENSKITFTQDGDNNDFTWNVGGYGYEKCPWYFKNCTFESSELPVTISGGNIFEPTVIGNVSIK